jgi:multidrug efflux pump subunit AcrA (membrane-fusion protein)
MRTATEGSSTRQPAAGRARKCLWAARACWLGRLGKFLLSAVILLPLLTSPGLGSQYSLAAGSSALNSNDASPALSDHPAEVELKGHLVPGQWLNLGFSSGGEIDQILVKEGDIVQAGQPVAQLGNLESYSANIAAAEFELVQAQLALKDLDEQAAYDLALAEQELAQADKARAFADSKLSSLQKLPDPSAVAQARANMLLAQNKVDKIKRDLRKAEKVWNIDSKNIIWRFIPRHGFKLNLLNLRAYLSLAETRYQNAVDAYHDRQKPADPLDLAQAEANLALAQARVQKARMDRDHLKDGPDPDQVALLQARIQAAESRLQASQSAYAATSLAAPISGTVVAVNLKPGEWAQPGQTVMVLADLSHWIVECTELTEDQVLALQPGQTLQVSLDALPQASLQGTLTSIGRKYQTVHGDVRFSAKIDLDASLPDFRWGMTARLQFSNRQLSSEN